MYMYAAHVTEVKSPTHYTLINSCTVHLYISSSNLNELPSFFKSRFNFLNSICIKNNAGNNAHSVMFSQNYYTLRLVVGWLASIVYIMLEYTLINV